MYNKEEIIRDEAVSFGDNMIEAFSTMHNGHIEFIELVKRTINRFYNPEDKRIFIDQLSKDTKRHTDLHESICTGGINCGISKTYKKMLFFLDQEFNSLPKIISTNTHILSNDRNNVFISYSHLDKSYLDELRKHFKPIEKYADFWDDSRIKPGNKWKNEIEASIKKAKVAVLLVSADFFNSQFIEQNELPPLLQAAEKDGVTILTVILKPCLFEEFPDINQYQAMNSPNKPLSDMSETERERVWVDLVRYIRDISKD